MQLPSLSVKYGSTKKTNSHNLSSEAETCYFDCIITSQHSKLVTTENIKSSFWSHVVIVIWHYYKDLKKPQLSNFFVRVTKQSTRPLQDWHFPRLFSKGHKKNPCKSITTCPQIIRKERSFLLRECWYPLSRFWTLYMH